MDHIIEYVRILFTLVYIVYCIYTYYSILVFIIVFTYSIRISNMRIRYAYIHATISVWKKILKKKKKKIKIKIIRHNQLPEWDYSPLKPPKRASNTWQKKKKKKKIKNISQLQSGATAPSNPRNVLVN